MNHHSPCPLLNPPVHFIFIFTFFFNMMQRSVSQTIAAVQQQHTHIHIHTNIHAYMHACIHCAGPSSLCAHLVSNVCACASVCVITQSNTHSHLHTHTHTLIHPIASTTCTHTHVIALTEHFLLLYFCFPHARSPVLRRSHNHISHRVPSSSSSPSLSQALPFNAVGIGAPDFPRIRKLLCANRGVRIKRMCVLVVCVCASSQITCNAACASSHPHIHIPPLHTHTHTHTLSLCSIRHKAPSIIIYTCLYIACIAVLYVIPTECSLRDLQHSHPLHHFRAHTHTHTHTHKMYYTFLSLSHVFTYASTGTSIWFDFFCFFMCVCL